MGMGKVGVVGAVCSRVDGPSRCRLGGGSVVACLVGCSGGGFVVFLERLRDLGDRGGGVVACGGTRARISARFLGVGCGAGGWWRLEAR